jgi:hypothetical protein
MLGSSGEIGKGNCKILWIFPLVDSVKGATRTNEESNQEYRDRIEGLTLWVCHEARWVTHRIFEPAELSAKNAELSSY